MLDLSQFKYLSFDCYGTLVDWELGILEAVMPILNRHLVPVRCEAVLELYAKCEREVEGEAWQPYREVLREVMKRIAAELRFKPFPWDLDALGSSLGKWPLFPDTVDALRRLKAGHGLVVLSNVDDDLFAQTARVLEVPFDLVITAEQVRSYKPGEAHFRQALRQLNVTPDKILHVAQSLYHDHVPAGRLGFHTVWINRPSRLGGRNIAPASEVKPDLEVGSLEELCRLMEART